MIKELKDYTLKELIQVIENDVEYQAHYVESCLSELRKRTLRENEIKEAALAVVSEKFERDLNSGKYIHGSGDLSYESKLLTRAEIREVFEKKFDEFISKRDIFYNGMLSDSIRKI